MKKKNRSFRSFFLFLSSVILLSSCSAQPADEPAVQPTPVPTAEPAEEKQTMKTEEELQQILDRLTPAQKIGQIVMVSIEQDQMNESLQQWLNKYEIGNVILYSKNINDAETAAELNRQLQTVIKNRTSIPALLAVDQEGGHVTRVHQGATIFPSSMAVGAAHPQDLYPVAWACAQELKSMGFNMNLAPVMDINSNPDNPVINIRSYGDDPQQAGELGGLWIRGLQENGIIASAKHFPGHGDTDIDSHFGLPVSQKSLNELLDTELVPFRHAIHSGVSTIMTSHILFPKIDKTAPATLSSRILNDLLRKEMGYTGVIISDSLQMSAVRDHFGSSQAAIQSLNAGVDLLLIGDGKVLDEQNTDPQNEILDALVHAVETGEIAEEDLNRAVMNVLKLKNSYRLFAVDPSEFHAPYPEELTEHQDLVQELSDQSITLIRDEEGLLPLPTESNLFVSFPSPYDLEYGHSSFCDVAADHLYGKPVTVHMNPTHAEIEEVLFQSDNYDTAIVLVNDMKNNPNQKVMIDRLLEKEMPLIVICIGSPYDLNELQEIKTVFCTYGYTPSSVLSAIALMNGTLTPGGILPVEVK